MKKRSVLVLEVRIDEELIEGKAGFLGRAPKEDLRRLTRAIRRAAQDRRIGALVLRMAQPGLGWSKAESLGRAVADFRAAKKPTVAYLEGAANVDFTLACACQTLVMPPGSTLYLSGLQAEILFFADLLGEIGLQPQIESVGEYKSAGEMFLRREMSGPHREAVEAVLADLTDQVLDAVARGRSLDRERVRELAEQGPHLAEDAMRFGLIDRVAHEDTCKTLLEESLGAKVAMVPHSRYRLGDGFLRRLVRFRRPRIALIYVGGMIAPGEERRSRSHRQVVAAGTLCRFLRHARGSRRVRAVVLRIDSPGGSAMASEMVRREIELTRKEKPLVVSMGDVAASGGYYIATAADAIIAEASTLTGSIGIVGGKLAAGRLLDKLGIHRQTVALGRRSDFLSPFRPFNESERALLRRHLAHFYENLFLPRVAEGRGLSIEQAHQIGRGRLWTGLQGKERGLVDGIGDLDRALDLAREKAGIPRARPVEVVSYVRRARLLDLVSFSLPWTEPARHQVLTAVFEQLDLLRREEVLFLLPAVMRIR